jgi:hypothetical protein
MSEVAVVAPPPLPAEVPAFSAEAKDYVREASAQNRRRAYRAAWQGRGSSRRRWAA